MAQGFWLAFQSMHRLYLTLEAIKYSRKQYGARQPTCMLVGTKTTRLEMNISRSVWLGPDIMLKKCDCIMVSTYCTLIFLGKNNRSGEAEILSTK